MKETLLTKQNSYIVGVSGGVDSMALLHQLLQKGYTVIVCHVDYHLRQDSVINQQLVVDFCEKYQIPCFCRDVKEEEYTKANFQMQAREIRYAYYQQIAKLYAIDTVLLGHHKDDVIETICMQLERKNTKGFLGIQEKSQVMGMQVLRPLLDESKMTLYQYCKDHQVPYYEDYTNFETDFTRDKIRNILLPTYSDAKKESLLASAKIHNIKVEQELKAITPLLKDYQRKGYISLATIPKQHLERVVYQMVKEQVYPPSISDALLQEIVKQIHSKQPNIEVSLPLNTVFIKEYDNIRVTKKINHQPYCLKFDHLVYAKHDYFCIAKQGHSNEGIALNKEDFPFYIRSPKPGDVIHTSGGTKKVSKLFKDRKIPKKDRVIWPIVESATGTVLLVPNIAKNIRYLSTKPDIFVIKYKDLRSEGNA